MFCRLSSSFFAIFMLMVLSLSEAHWIWVYVPDDDKDPSDINDLFRIDHKISVRTKNGFINGRAVEFEGKVLTEFLGIPYAKPPIGELRFKKPVPVGQWSQPIDAFNWPNPCIQRPRWTKYFINKELSEDCLYLNIWSPIVPESNVDLKPVMFFIHGGTFSFGTSGESYLRGHILSSKGDVVVVTINYRLNIFGFLYTGSDDAPGNMGLWDQVLALEWINNNIENFGGDSDRITIFGQSAGGWSVTLHILSPVTRNLFQNAIAMSGAVNSQLVCEPEVVQELWFKSAEYIGCQDSDSTDETNIRFTPKMIECIRKSSAEDLLHMQPMSFECLSSVVIDGQFITDSVIQMLETADYKKNFNFLIGTVEVEGADMLAKLTDFGKYNRMNPAHIDYRQAYNDLKRNSTLFCPLINGKDVAKHYFSGLSDNDSTDLLRRTVGIGIGDSAVTCPTIGFAEKIYKSDGNTNVFQYYYTSKLGEVNPFCGTWMGTCHSSDLLPVFGVPFAESDSYADRDREISLQMIDIFSTFAKTGRPSEQFGTEWKKYYRINRKIIRPYFEISTQQNVGNHGIGLKINECDHLWRDCF